MIFTRNFKRKQIEKGLVPDLGSVVDACDLSRDMQETISDEKRQAFLCFPLQVQKKRLERGLGFRAWILRL